jgi:mono/diheme cytochrome c family protein
LLALSWRAHAGSRRGIQFAQVPVGPARTLRQFGNPRGKNQMPPWGDFFKPDQLEQLWAYIMAGER